MRRSIRLVGLKRITKQNGRQYLYRRVGSRLVPLPDLPVEHPDFQAAWVAAGSVAPVAPKNDGSIAAACARYLASESFRALAVTSKQSRLRVVEKIRLERGAGFLTDLRREHINRDLNRLTPGAAANRVKAWRAILSIAVEEGFMDPNVLVGLRPPKARTNGHVQWSGDDIAQFRSYWPDRSAQRVAFEVLYWTAARCSDAVALGGRALTPDGWLRFTQSKTGGDVSVPISDNLATWAQELENDQQSLLRNIDLEAEFWISTMQGKPRSVKGLSQWFSKAAAQAGLKPGLTAHGLRKARAASLAEIGASAHQIGAWTGHSSLKEVSQYTRAADRRRILSD